MVSPVIFMTVLAGDGGSEAAPVTPAATVNAVNFNGTNTYLSHVFTFPNGKEGTLSFWIAGGAGTLRRVLVSQNFRFHITIDASDNLSITGRDTGNTVVLQMIASSPTFTGTGWRHVVASWNGSTRLLYVDREAATLSTNTRTDTEIDYTDGNYGVGALGGGTQLMPANLSELLFHTSFLDISQESNIDKFINANLKPVDLGADGSTPFGVQPVLFLSGDTDSWHTNNGSNGGLTENGALTTAATSPSD